MVIITLFSSFIHDDGRMVGRGKKYLSMVQKLEKLENGKLQKKKQNEQKNC